MIKYRISNWEETFEVSQSKRCEVMKWIALPYNPSSYGFCALMERPDGPEVYGIFCMLALEASQSRTRGELTRGSRETPHDARTLSVKLRVKEAKLKAAIQVLSSEEVGWIEAEVIPEEEDQSLPGFDSERTPSRLDTSAPTVQDGTVQDGTGQDETEQDPTSKEVEGVMPAGWKSMSQEKAKKARVKSNTPLMVELGSLFNRMESTKWTVAEAMALLEILPIEPEEYRAVRTYYRATIDKREDFRRRDLLTLLNNWLGEADRASRRANTATGGVVKKEKVERPMPEDFEAFLDYSNPSLLDRKDEAWRHMKKEYDEWKEAQDA
jgi:hypothetical protein